MGAASSVVPAAESEGYANAAPEEAAADTTGEVAAELAAARQQIQQLAADLARKGEQLLATEEQNLLLGKRLEAQSREMEKKLAAAAEKLAAEKARHQRSIAKGLWNKAQAALHSRHQRKHHIEALKHHVEHELHLKHEVEELTSLRESKLISAKQKEVFFVDVSGHCHSTSHTA